MLDGKPVEILQTGDGVIRLLYFGDISGSGVLDMLAFVPDCGGKFVAEAVSVREMVSVVQAKTYYTCSSLMD